MAIERILGTDTGKAAFEKADRNAIALEAQMFKTIPTSLSSSNFNEILDNGIYQIVPGSNNNNNGVGYGHLMVTSANGYVIQRLYDMITTTEFIRRYNNITWTSWEKVVTDKQPNWITATLQNGWTGAFLYRKNQLNQLEVKFNLTAGTKDPYTVILGLPTGYQPEYFFDIALMSPENAQKAYFYYNAGSATIYVSPVVAVAAGQKCAGSFVVPL